MIFAVVRLDRNAIAASEDYHHNGRPGTTLACAGKTLLDLRFF
ncbi:hypothetical protein GCM10009754_88390 [Amycolatopsis minnesotensis]|uniref:Uncharacterized protein n=1 Tax=Amycolatopsis minnesotensis TaxID=337894 RepID=A0ABP5EDB0_9PSEU